MNLSGIELYYSGSIKDGASSIELSGEEYKHITRVMRHSEGDQLYVTDGAGKIYSGSISEISKNQLTLLIDDSISTGNKFRNIHMCIPKIKSSDRLEFALEKCTELGITNFVIYDAGFSFAKKEKTDRWNKILVAAMKQSLHAYLPGLTSMSSLKEILEQDGEMIMLDQAAELNLSEIKIDSAKDYYFIIGPEGGFTGTELKLAGNTLKYRLTDNRLRTETAAVACVSIINFV